MTEHALASPHRSTFLSSRCSILCLRSSAISRRGFRGFALKVAVRRFHVTRAAQALRVGSLPSCGCHFFPARMALSARPHEHAVFWMQVLEAQNKRVLMIGSCLLRAPARCGHEVAKFGTGAHLPWTSPDAEPEHPATGGSPHAPLIFNAEVRSAS